MFKTKLALTCQSCVLHLICIMLCQAQSATEIPMKVRPHKLNEESTCRICNICILASVFSDNVRADIILNT